MEKSTPLAQLQQMKESNTPATVPNTVAPPEIQEDEKAVNDTLSQFQFSAQNKTPNNVPMQSTHQMSSQPIPQQNMHDEYAEMTDEDYENMMQNGGVERFEGKKDLLTLFRTKAELKRMVIVIVVFILVSIIPVDIYVQKYVDLSRFPYLGLLLKGFLAGLMYMILYSLF